MSLEQDVFNQLVSVYPQGLVNITQLSYNKTGCYNFIISDAVGFNFDLVDNLSTAYPSPQKEKTPDSLFLVNDALCFVEFKEGGHNKPDIRLKIHEGIVALYMFALKHMPQLSRDEFFSLKINYAVVARPPAQASAFRQALSQVREKYQLENLQGFIVRNTTFAVCPNITARLIKQLTNGAATYIEIQSRNGTCSKVHG